MCSQMKEAAPPFAVSKRGREVKTKRRGIWTMGRSGWRGSGAGENVSLVLII